MLKKLRNDSLTLEKESDVAGFLVTQLTVDKDKGTMELIKTGLIDRIIIDTGLDDVSPNKIPAEYEALPKDKIVKVAMQISITQILLI